MMSPRTSEMLNQFDLISQHQRMLTAFRGPAGPFSLKTVHWTVFRALNATAVGKLKKRRDAPKSFPTAVGKYPRSGG